MALCRPMTFIVYESTRIDPSSTILGERKFEGPESVHTWRWNRHERLEILINISRSSPGVHSQRAGRVYERPSVYTPLYRPISFSQDS